MRKSKLFKADLPEDADLIDIEQLNTNHELLENQVYKRKRLFSKNPIKTGEQWIDGTPIYRLFFDVETTFKKLEESEYNSASYRASTSLSSIIEMVSGITDHSIVDVSIIDIHAFATPDSTGYLLEAARTLLTDGIHLCHFDKNVLNSKRIFGYMDIALPYEVESKLKYDEYTITSTTGLRDTGISHNDDKSVFIVYNESGSPIDWTDIYDNVCIRYSQPLVSGHSYLCYMVNQRIPVDGIDGKIIVLEEV